MKKFLLGGLLTVCTLLMTSCLGEGSNQSTGYAFGIVEYSQKAGGYVFNVGDTYPFYSAEMATNSSIYPGDCCYFYYEYDADIPANADVATTGYVTVTMSPSYYTTITDYYVNSGVIDTATYIPSPSELPIVKIEPLSSGYIWSIIDNYLFLPTYHEGLTGAKQTYSLTFDSEQTPETSTGENVYNLYLSTTLTSAGTSPTVNEIKVNAFNISPVVNSVGQLEKAAGKSYFKFKINYVSSLTDDNSKATWASSDVATYYFATE